jgi:glycosyltransferase involved in cell wall biosynthesis
VLTVGVAARNEEATIGQTLRSIQVALAETPAPGAEIVVAVNGCTDRTREIAERHGVTVIESAPGLIPAQTAIMEAARHAVIFVDADCLVAQDCLRELVRAMEEHPEAEAAWASMVPADPDPGFWTRVYNFADYHPEVVRRGRHLCGRAFTVRRYEVSWRVPAVDPRIARHLGLERGPISDDSYLSRAIINRSGAGAIHHAVDARVMFQPIRRLRDFARAQRRKSYEAHRLDLLYPEWRGVRRRHFGRRLDPAARHRLRPVRRLQCRLYVLLYATCGRVAALRLSAGLALVRLGVPVRPCDVWPVVEGTKRPFGGAVPGAFTTAAAPRPPVPAPRRTP